MNDKTFFEQIPEKYWAAASPFKLEGIKIDSPKMTVSTPESSEDYDMLTPELLEKLMHWMGQGSPLNHRWVILELPVEAPDSTHHCYMLQAGIFDDGLITCEYQFALREEGGWIAKNFGREFEPSALDEVSSLFSYCLEHRRFFKSMALWQPFVLPEF